MCDYEYQMESSALDTSWFLGIGMLWHEEGGKG